MGEGDRRGQRHRGREEGSEQVARAAGQAELYPGKGHRRPPPINTSIPGLCGPDEPGCRRDHSPQPGDP